MQYTRNLHRKCDNQMSADDDAVSFLMSQRDISKPMPSARRPIHYDEPAIQTLRASVEASPPTKRPDMPPIHEEKLIESARSLSVIQTNNSLMNTDHVEVSKVLSAYVDESLFSNKMVNSGGLYQFIHKINIICNIIFYKKFLDKFALEIRIIITSAAPRIVIYSLLLVKPSASSLT